MHTAYWHGNKLLAHVGARFTSRKWQLASASYHGRYEDALATARAAVTAALRG